MRLFCKRKKSGFTLVELIVVIAILAILAGIAIPVYSGYIKKANKASDLQLLDAVNTAFAAACMENGFNAKDVTKANLTVENKKITGVSGVEVPADKIFLTAKNEGYSPVLLGAHAQQLAFSQDNFDASFAKYFGSNSDAELKYYESSDDFAFVNGVFVDAKDSAAQSGKLSVTIGDKTYTYTQAQIDAYHNSNYDNVQPSELTASVDSLATALGDNKTGLAALANMPNFKAKLVELGVIDADTTITASMLSDAELAKKVSNASVLYVASVAGSMDPDRVYNAFVEGNIDELVEGTGMDSTFVSAALQYGLLTAFVNTEDGAFYKDDFMADSLNVHGLTDVNNLFKKYTNDKGTGTYYDYKAYLESNAAADDIKGFLSALSIINENAGNFDLSSSYSSDDILDAVNQILGNN